MESASPSIVTLNCQIDLMILNGSKLNELYHYSPSYPSQESKYHDWLISLCSAIPCIINYQILWSFTNCPNSSIHIATMPAWDITLYYHILHGLQEKVVNCSLLSFLSLASSKHIFHIAIRVTFLNHKLSKDSPLTKTIQWLSISLRIKFKYFRMAM